MEIDSGAWAKSDFDPDLEVKIFGLTAEEKGNLEMQPKAENRKIIGRWLDDNPPIAGRVSIFRQDGTLFFERVFADGSKHKQEIVETDSEHGRRFEEADDPVNGEHWLLESDGNLQSRDNDGLYESYSKIDVKEER